MALASAYQLPLFLTEKQCTACGEAKPLTAFPCDPRYKGGYRHECCACRTARHRRYRAAIAATTTPTQDAEKVCGVCQQRLPIAAFRRNPSVRSGYHSTCRDCQNARQRALWAAQPERYRQHGRTWYHANRDERRAAHRAYYASHTDAHKARGQRWRKRNALPLKARAHAYFVANREAHRLRARAHMATRRARIRAAGGAFTRQDIEALFAQQGGACYYCNTPLHTYDVDHKQPLSRGGSNDPSNLALACEWCNGHKHDKTEQEFWALRAAEATPLSSPLAE